MRYHQHWSWICDIVSFPKQDSEEVAVKLRLLWSEGESIADSTHGVTSFVHKTSRSITSGHVSESPKTDGHLHSQLGSVIRRYDDQLYWHRHDLGMRAAVEIVAKLIDALHEMRAGNRN